MLQNVTKKIRAITFIALTSIALFLPVSVSAQAKEKEFVIKAGTPIEVATMSEISSKTHPLGTVIELKLLNSVVVKKNTVIPAGTIVKGKVTQCKKRSVFGVPGLIAIDANSITAVDGTLVPISGLSFRNDGISRRGWAWGCGIVGTLCLFPFGFLIPGSHGIIPAGTQLSGNVMSNTTITMESDDE